MPLITIVVLVIFFGSTFAIIALGVIKSIKSKKDAPIIDIIKPVQKEKVTESDNNDLEEIAVIIAAIETFTSSSASFTLRKIIRKEDGSILWNKAGTKQNLNATI